MITLFNFGPAFGLPDPSPFVMKTETLLKIGKSPLSDGQLRFSAGAERQAALYRR
jgi:hypothetical protein